jgi:arylformamidase
LMSCRWKQVADDLPASLIQGALAISGLYDLEPIRHTPFLQADLRLTPSQVARLSPAFFPRPKAGVLQAVAGGNESEEFLRHNQLIRDVWGPTAVPVCEAVPGFDHFTILDSLVEPRGRLQALALGLLGLG